jgi:hypothetical protein
VVNTDCCSSTFFPWARRRGVTLFEPFGGLGAGLELLLRHGVSINRYIYCDTSPTAQTVILHRLRVLSDRYPSLLPQSAWLHALDTLPCNVYNITQQQLTSLVESQQPSQWLVVAGWECADLSAAGSGQG